VVARFGGRPARRRLRHRAIRIACVVSSPSRIVTVTDCVANCATKSSLAKSPGSKSVSAARKY
jgi:hypothetical protein